MKNLKMILGLFMAMILLLSSCAKKEELTERTYYAKLLIDVANLPGTPPLEVRYQGQLLGDAPFLQPGINVTASKDTKLAIYVKGTDELVADTVLNLAKNSLTGYRVAYNKELGISGWINSKPVSPDSVSVQFLNNLGTEFETHPAYDFCLFAFDFNTGEIVNYGLVVPDFQKVRLTPKAVMLPLWFDKSQSMTHIFLGKLKDKATGEFIPMPSGEEYFFLDFPSEGGFNCILNIGLAEGEIRGRTIIL